MFLISDNVDTYTGMRLAGVDGVVVHERKELREQLEKVLQDKSIGIVLLNRTQKRLYHLIYYRSHRTEIVRQKFLKEEILLTLEEKITHLRTTSMEEARAESNAIIDSYRDALEKVFEDHKIEAKRQMQTRIKAETVNARQQKNQAMARAQLDLKRRQGRIQQELKDKIFEEAYALVNDYMKTAEYDDFLLRCIHNAIVFANGEEMTIYLNPSDEEKRSSLEDATGIHLTISAEDFTGGIRAVIRSRNILIDHSFKTALRNEYDKFLFSGGDSIV